MIRKNKIEEIEDLDDVYSVENEANDEVNDIDNLDEDIDDSDDSDDIDNSVISVENSDDEDIEEEDDGDIMFKFNTNNHKIEGKHALSRDTIFKGKLEESNAEMDLYTSQNDINMSDGLPIETGTIYEFESKYNEEYTNRLKLSKDVYDLLKDKTELDFSSNRRKPNRNAFNDYYRMLISNIGKEYTKSEIFVELSYYFTDNIFNMFKLLDKEYATQIIVELKQSGHLNNLNNINFI